MHRVNLKKIVAFNFTFIKVFETQLKQLLASLVLDEKPRDNLESFVLDGLAQSMPENEREVIQADVLYALNKLAQIKDEVPQERLTRYSSMILRTAVQKLPSIRKDPLIPVDTKDLMTQDAVFDSFSKMAAVKYSQEFNTLIVEFEVISEEIGKELIKRGDERGRHWNVRARELWDWCRVLIEDTAHPSFFWLQGLEVKTEKQQLALQKFNDLFEVLVKTVMWVSFPDDMADNYKHVRLTELFNAIPFATEAELKTYRSDTSNIDGGLFTKYFDHAVKVWKSAEADLERIIGPEYSKNKNELKENYKWICRSMLFSAKMNEKPRDHSNVVNNEKHLQHNMMATSFNTLQTMLCLALLADEVEVRVINPFTDSTFGILRQIAQENARRSNNIATFTRELFEGDLSNIMFSKINNWYCSPEMDRSRYIIEILAACLKHQGVISCHKLQIGSDDAKKMTFFDLLLHRGEAEKVLFHLYRKLDTSGKLVEFQKDYKKATEEIEKSLDSKDLEQIHALKAYLKSMKSLILLLANESNIFRMYYREWEDGRRAMIDNVHSYSEQGDLPMLQKYIRGWDKVHITYLAMKYERIF